MRLPYWSWVQVLRTLDARRAARRSCPSSRRRRRRCGADSARDRELIPDLPASSGADSECARFQLFDSTTALLRRVAAERPLLVILDDLHAADTPSIMLLRFIVTQLTDIAFLVVGTYRDLELTPDHPLTIAISDMARGRATRVVMVGGLDSDAVSEYIAAETGVEPDGFTVAAVGARRTAIRCSWARPCDCSPPKGA